MRLNFNSSARVLGTPIPSKGFTLIEVMVSMLILTIGILGVFAMQIVSIRSNGGARKNTEAVEVAEQFVGKLRQDATYWKRRDPSNLGGTKYLSPAILTPGNWVVGTPNGPVSELGVSHTALTGGDAALLPRATFCIAYRLDWAIQDEIISGDVRIYWPHSNASQDILDDCGITGNIKVADLDVDSLAEEARVLSQVGMYTVPVTFRVTQEP